ncbi:MAG: hypothetical protein GXY83_33130 [Rhodopirellula sp.]|nr:hypothetical protein [Rhodopirellula sp.]
MPQPDTASQANPPQRPRRARQIAVGVLALLLAAGLGLYGRASMAWWTRMIAGMHLDHGAISVAQQWLAWSARLDPGNGATDLMRAACFRRLRQPERWREALRAAEQKGTPASQVRLETRLGQIQDGDFDNEIQDELTAIIKAGVSPTDFYAALVNGYLARKDPGRAEAALDAWAATEPKEAHLAFTQGLYWLRLSQAELEIPQRRDLEKRAQRELENALARQPRFELARIALAELFEDQNRLEEACGQYSALLAGTPANETARLKLAKLFRRLNRLAEARTMLASLPPQPQTLDEKEIAAEMGELELESGNYQAAEHWFARAQLDAPDRGGVVGDAAICASLQEKPPRARQLFDRIDAIHRYNVRLEDVVSRFTTGADDPQAEAELRALEASRPGGGGAGTGPTGADAQEDTEATGAGLYALHCSGCHGENGDGKGRAARHLFPKPRDLRTDRFRLVSTVNGIPSLEDLEAGLRRGMPGTSMRAFDNLDEDQRMMLAQEVRRLNRLGMGEHFIDTLLKQGEEIDEDEVRQVLKLRTTAGEDVRAPRIAAVAEPQAIARGHEAYSKLGCQTCHGEDGTGVWEVPLFDEKGRPSPPRDLVREPFKGGHEPDSIYLRLLLGMPGTPHPALPGVADEQLIDLVQYCRSLSQEPKREQTNHQRALQAWTVQESPSPRSRNR